jgi:glycerol-3-phosphate acyltransferase PlsX
MRSGALAAVLVCALAPIISMTHAADPENPLPYHVEVAGILQRENPRIGLLNIGEEPEKGNELAVETYRLLEESGLNFVGNVEGRDIVAGPCDVLVTDGFAGNVLLKFYESIAAFMVKLVRKEIASTGVHYYAISTVAVPLH